MDKNINSLFLNNVFALNQVQHCSFSKNQKNKKETKILSSMDDLIKELSKLKPLDKNKNLELS